MASDETRYELRDPQRSVEAADLESFDRIAFAMRVLDRLSDLRPQSAEQVRARRLTVAVYSSVSALRIERGRDLGRADGSGWAMVGIPPHASREHIAYSLAALAGAASVPFVVQCLLADESPSRNG